jgi:thiamine-monophosphate kinase
MVSEFAVIDRIAPRAARRPGVLVGIGDDAAVLEGDPPVVVTHDLLVDGVHFRWHETSPADLGHKAVAVNLSDLAAMGAQPVAVIVGLGLPRAPALTLDQIDDLYAGMDAIAGEHDASLAGGDVSEAPVLILAVTAVGRMPDGRPPVLRSGAKAGDVVCVTGALGASAAGLALLERPELRARVPEAEALVAAHLRPSPRVAEGRALSTGGVHAMLDCSDGLALDAGRLAMASGLALTLHLDQLPVAAGVAGVALALGTPADVLAATGGEDYELICAAAPAAVAGLAGALDVELTAVGELHAGPVGEVRALREGADVPLARLGWEHGA